MGLEIPDEVKWLSWIIGQDWPEGDETAMRRLATAWEDAATGVDDLTSDLEMKAATVLSVVEGPAADSFREFWNTFVTTDPEYLPKLAEMCRALAKQCDDGANEIEYGKYMFIALLIVTAIQIAILIANMIETFGASAAGIPVVEGAAQVTSRTIAQQLLMAILKSVAWSELQSVGLDVLVQSIQIMEGHRDGLDLGKTGTAALSGLVNGVVGGAVGFGAGKIPGLSGAASPFKGMVQGAAREALSGAVSGVVGSVATTAIEGGDLSPDALAKAATSGGFGGAIGGAKGGMHEGAQAASHSGGEDAPSVRDSDFGGSQSDGRSSAGSDGSPSGSDGSSSGSDGASGGSDGSPSGSDGSPSGSDGTSDGSPGPGDHTTGSGSGSTDSYEPHAGSDDGGSPGGTDSAPHTASSGDGGGSVTGDHPAYGDSGAGSDGSHAGSDGGGTASTTAPHVSTDGSNAAHPSGDGSSHPDSTSGGSSHDDASSNRTGLLNSQGGSAASSAPPPASSGGTTTGYDGGGSPAGHASSAGRMDALLNRTAPGGGSDNAAPGSPQGTTLADAGTDAPAGVPMDGGTPADPGRGNVADGPGGTAPTTPPAAGMPMAPPMGGGGVSGPGGGGDQGSSVRTGGDTSAGPRASRPPAMTDRPAGTTERPTTARDAGSERPGGPGTDRRPGSFPGDDRPTAESTPPTPRAERPFPSPAGVPAEPHGTPADRAPAGDSHGTPGEGEPRPGPEPTPGRPDSVPAESAPESDPVREGADPAARDGAPTDQQAPAARDTEPGRTDPTARPDAPEPHDGAEPRTADPHDGAEPRTADPHDGAEPRTAEHGGASPWPGEHDAAAGDSYTLGPSGDPVGLHEYAVPGDFHDCGDGIGTNDQRAVPLLEDYHPWGDLPDKAAFDAAHRPDGRVQWPPNEGAAGPPRRVTLPAGTVLDRFGYPGGEYLSPLRPDGHPYSYGDRAILPDSLAKGYHAYVLDAPVTVDLADIAPAFEQDGGGRQVKLIDTDLASLLDGGLIHEVATPPSDGLVLPHDFGVTRPDGTVPEPTTVDDARQPHPGTGPVEHPTEPRTPGHDPSSPAEPHPGHTADQPHHDGVPHDGAHDGTHDASHDASHDGAHDGGHVPADVPEHLPQHLHDVYAASEETPAGRSLYTPEQQNMRDLAQRVHADPNHYVLDGHGNADGMRFGDRTLSARDVADIVRSDPNWNGRDLLLVSCETGAHSDAFAAQLAHELGVPVIAPDHLAWTDNQGRVYSSSGEHGANGEYRPTWPPDGNWHTYRPDGSVTPSGHDGFPPRHTDETSPHGQDHGHHTAARGDDTTPEHDQDDHHGGTGSGGHAPIHAIDPRSPYAEAFHPPTDVPVVHVPADDPRVVPGEPFSHQPGLEPNTRYEVEGRGTFWTDQNGHVRHVDAEIPNTRNGQNPDVHHPLPSTQYHVRTEQGSIAFTTDQHGNPPNAALFEPPTHVIGDPGGPPAEVPTVTVGEHPGSDGSIPAPQPGEGFTHRTDLQPNTRYDVYDTHGNHVGTYTTDGTGVPRWIETESGRQYRQHPEFGANLKDSVQYRTSENFDLNNPKPPDANFTPPPHDGESRIRLDSKTGDSLHRKIGPKDPFVGRDGLEPNHKYIIENQRSGKRVEPYAICYTDGEGKVVAVDTFRPFNPDLNSPNPDAQIRVNHVDQNGVSRPTVLNTRHPVTVAYEKGNGDYVGSHSITHDPDPTRPDNGYRRDKSAQDGVGEVGRIEYAGTQYAGGHGARNAEGMMGEAAGQMPQLHSQNSGLNREGVTRPESWYQMESDRAERAGAGATIGPINALGAFIPLEGTPGVMWQVWAESNSGQPPRLFIRSFWNVPAAAASRPS
jgi:Tuberculosis necrotizing toxin